MTKILRFLLAILLLLPPLAPSQMNSAPAQKEADIWASFRVFAGQWEGRGEGKTGVSKGKMEFQFVLRGKFLQVQNESRLEPKDKNAPAEIHEDFGLFSYDQARECYVFRQFHAEGFVNQYICKKILDEGKTFIFVSEQLENLPPAFKARLTYKIVNPKEFQMTFDLATPGKDFECYQSGVMKRIK